MTDLEAIRLRKSRRSYTGPLAASQAAALRELTETFRETGVQIQLHENSNGFGGFRKSYGMFSGVRSYFVLAGDKQDPYLYEKAGHAGEQLVLHATKMGLGTCWVAGTFDRNSIAAALAPGQVLIAVITVGPVESAPSLKEKLLRSGIHIKDKKLEQMYTANRPPAWFLEGVRAAWLAPSGMNKKPVHFTYRNNTAYAAIPDAAPHQYTDLGIAKLHFELAANGTFALGNNAAFHRETT